MQVQVGLLTCAAKTYRPRPQLSCACLNANPPHPRELPGGAFWLSREATNFDVVYGQDFVLQRPKHGGPGLVVSDKSTKLSRSDSGQTTKLAVRSQTSGPLARPGQASLWDLTDITDYSFLGEAGLLPGGKAPFLLPGGAMTILPPPANTACTGMILHPAFERPPQEASLPDKNPRRTKKVKFTCKRCETTNVKRVSPHGWSAGSVFARCDGCNVVHKLVDNLKIFTEVQGSIFPTKPAASMRIPKGLPQKPELDYHVHPAIYPLLPKDGE